MGQPLSRKSMASARVETLEDRRLLNGAWAFSAWDVPAYTSTDHAELAPPARGPISATGDAAGRFGPESPGWANSTPAPDPTPRGWPSDVPAFSDPARSSSPAFGPQQGVGDHSTWREGWAANEGQDWTGTAPVVASPATSSSSSTTPSQSTLKATSIDTAGAPPGAESPLALAPESPTRAATAGLPARSIGGFAPTSSRVEAASTPRAESPEPSTSGESAPAVVGPLPVDPGAVPSISSRGSSPSGPVIGPATLSGQARLVLNLGASRAAEARSPDEPPRTSIQEPERIEIRSADDHQSPARPVEGLDRPDPRLADLIMDLLPVDRASLEGIVDRFLDPIEGLSASMSGLDGPLRLLAASLSLAATVLTVDVSLRIRRGRRKADEMDDDEGLVGFPGLPGLGMGGGSVG